MILPDCMMPDGAEPCAAFQTIRAERDDLAIIVRQLIRLVKRTAPVNADTVAANRAQEYLERKGLSGSITR